MSERPLTADEALVRADQYRQEAVARLRSMSIGGQREYDRLMLEAYRWKDYADGITNSVENK